MNAVTVEDFVAWCKRDAPRFERTVTNESPWHASLPPVVHVRHTLGARPTSADLESLQAQLAGVAPLLGSFYSRHDGAHLFAVADESEPDAGFHICPIAEMPNLKADVEEWFKDSTEDAEPKNENGWLLFYNLPSWFESAVVFARFGHAAERMLVACTGPYAGAVFLFEHDPLGLLKVAESVEAIFRRIVTDPVRFLKGQEGNALYGIKTYATDA